MMTTAPDSLRIAQKKYEARRAALERAWSRADKRLKLWSTREDRFAIARLLVAASLVMVLAGFYQKMDAAQVFLGWLFFLIVFFVSSAVHARLKKIRARCEGVAQVFSTEKLRLERDWEALRHCRPKVSVQCWQETMEHSGEHPYRSDLDLGGTVAVWMDTCTLPEGSQKLAEELLQRGVHPLSEPQFKERQRIIETLAAESKALRRWESYRLGPAVAELQPLVREKETEEPSAASGEVAGAQSESPLQGRLLEVLLWGIVFAQLAYWFMYFIPALLRFLETADVLVLSEPLTPFFPLLLIGALVWESWRKKVQQSGGRLTLRELRVLSALEDVSRCLVRRGQEELIPVSEGKRFRLLRMTFELGEVRRNPFVWLLLNVLLPFDALTFALTLLIHRRLDGRADVWWSNVVQFDFLAALARIRLENAEFNCPQMASESLDVRGLAHPLLRLSERVGNDFHLDPTQRCLLLTGSNMAGKSTLLRSLGLNALLAQMGTVVCAEKYSGPHLEILCAIQVSDSLESGASYFYAEVKRLASVLAGLKTAPRDAQRRLFLIDEIFRGTNNRERFLGSWQVISALLSTGAFGFLTTHDLALTGLEKRVDGVRNFHLRETVGEQGLLEFDYLLRPGPCPTTNALIIMKQAGLPVELNFNPEV